ncbi:MAG: 30S ribosomal protein S27e [Nitrososphaerales archaeon]
MKKLHIPIPKPRSNCLSIKCAQCGKETIVFTHTNIDIKCKSCTAIIAERTGSRAKLFSKEFKQLD